MNFEDIVISGPYGLKLYLRKGTDHNFVAHFNVNSFEHMTKFIVRIGSFLLVSLSIWLTPILSGCMSENVYSPGKIGGPFADYDTAVRNSVMHRWSDLEGGRWPDRYGKIVLQF